MTEIKRISEDPCFPLTVNSCVEVTPSPRSQPSSRNKRKAKASPSYRKRSPLFAAIDPTSCYSCVESLGSLVEALGGATPLRQCAAGSSSSPCAECQAVIDPAVALFKNCPKFLNLYNSGVASLYHQDTATLSESCWRNREYVLEDSVRHLCEKECFMRAYLPYRAWYDLNQRALSAKFYEKWKGYPLEGWTCHPVAGSDTPKVYFQNINDESGKRYDTIPKVLNYFGTKKALTKALASKRRRIAEFDPQPLEKYLHVKLEDSVRSPMGLLEELVADDPWRLLLSTILLNRTSRAQVDRAFFEFLQRWPSPQEAVRACTEEIVEVIHSLGFHKRAEGIQRFSRDYMVLVKSKDPFHLTMAEVLSLHQCGKYSYEAYRLFIDRDAEVIPKDHALAAYADYKFAIFVKDGKNNSPRDLSTA